MPQPVVLAALVSMVGFDARVEALRSVERARYAFVIVPEAPRPFDAVYTRTMLAGRVIREQAEEEVLGRVFGLVPSAEQLEQEFERIESATRDAPQWEAIKAALGNDRAWIEQVVCRPILVSRALRLRF